VQEPLAVEQQRPGALRRLGTIPSLRRQPYIQLRNSYLLHIFFPRFQWKRTVRLLIIKVAIQKVCKFVTKNKGLC
jgi:hypothetical protein